jgi:hypothetical protein
MMSLRSKIPLYVYHVHDWSSLLTMTNLALYNKTKEHDETWELFDIWLFMEYNIATNLNHPAV